MDPMGQEAGATEENAACFELYLAGGRAGHSCVHVPRPQLFATRRLSMSHVAARRRHAGASAEELQALRVQLMQHALPFVQGYIWQHDRFNLQLSATAQPPWEKQRARQAQAAPVAPSFWGLLRFGDNIEDEWFLVWLLLELSRAFPVTARCGLWLWRPCRLAGWHGRQARHRQHPRLPPAAGCGTTTGSSC